MDKNIEILNHKYWINRASTYSDVNKEELAGIQRENWSNFLVSKIKENYPGKAPSEINILDIGAGPGFISIILAEAGYKVTAFDFAETMLKEARENAGTIAESINYVQGDAMALPFDKNSFDVVFSRNLIWNLPFPEKAYDEWVRVLKPAGLMMVFDANWYTYLVDDKKKLEYQQDRENVAAEGLGDYNIGEDFDKMEQIAADLPSTKRHRPQWDAEYLSSISAGEIEIIEDIGSVLYSEKEKINYKSTPLFMVKLIKAV